MSEVEVLPHITLTGPVELKDYAAQFETSRCDGNGWIVRLKDIYMASVRANALVECAAVRSGFSQDFYIRIEVKGKGLTVRVDPYMRIERNEGVQRAILGIARQLQAAFPALTLENTNLPPELLAEDAGVKTDAGGDPA